MKCKEITSTNTVIGERIYKDTDLFEIEKIDRRTAFRLNAEKQNLIFHPWKLLRPI
ncbi:MAG: hypothetical protein HXS48_23985 [Theionarchaea archaeon]|nr:hypothetical protein [Theionarchaea archaeon]